MDALDEERHQRDGVDGMLHIEILGMSAKNGVGYTMILIEVAGVFIYVKWRQIAGFLLHNFVKAQ